MARGSKRLSQYVEEKGIEAEVVTLDSSTRTFQIAADSLGCEVAQIAKSIVFTGDTPVVVVIAGDKRVDPKKLSEHLGWKAKIADADAVRNGTGYVIGGVPPFAHEPGVVILLDSSLARFDDVWAAAGRPHSVMRLGVSDLAEVVGGGFVDLAK